MKALRDKDWDGVAEALDLRGYARLPRLLNARECAALDRQWSDEARFRSFVDMAQHAFGEGHYRYFSRPLPTLVDDLRTQLYAPLAKIANVWAERLGEPERYPARLSRFLAQCHAAEQKRPTPLLLHYEAGGFNCLHQDRYGDVAFPLQVAVLLSRSPADTARDGRPADFGGGEFLLVEQRPRQQSRGEAIALRRGEAVIFPNAVRPVRSTRGWYRAKIRHGVSSLSSGHRSTLGVIFHDAR